MMTEDNQRISTDQAVDEALGDVFQAAHVSGVNLALSNLLTKAHYHCVAFQLPPEPPH